MWRFRAEIGPKGTGWHPPPAGESADSETVQIVHIGYLVGVGPLMQKDVLF